MSWNSFPGAGHHQGGGGGGYRPQNQYGGPPPPQQGWNNAPPPPQYGQVHLPLPSLPIIQLQRRRACADLKIAMETHLLHSNIKDITMVLPVHHPEITQGSSTMLLLLSVRLRQITINKLEQDTCLPIVSRVISLHSVQHLVS